MAWICSAGKIELSAMAQPVKSYHGTTYQTVFDKRFPNDKAIFENASMIVILDGVLQNL